MVKVIVMKLVNVKTRLNKCKRGKQFTLAINKKLNSHVRGEKKTRFLNLACSTQYMMQSPEKDVLELAILISSLNM